jgi:hypothetical protein
MLPDYAQPHSYNRYRDPRTVKMNQKKKKNQDEKIIRHG